uniref:Integrase catalytic domain-containing protein n=1 Tax=Trichuris muris TaxID=70415 RepID=A0A5S6R5S5_TRIMR
MEQEMAPLPASRLQGCFPFEQTGLDFVGPLYVRQGRKKTKGYICLFTRTATRAIHLEVTSDVSTKQFLHCLRRFFARRGHPITILSDNFRTFKAADRELHDLYKTLDCEKIRHETTSNRIHYLFITERAPWTGEHLVRSVKAPLRKVLRKTTLNFFEMRTVLCEVEPQVNSRPLTFVGDDPTSGDVLTPFHFLIGRGQSTLPEVTAALPLIDGTNTSERHDLRRRSAYQQRLLTHFWKRWRQEYIVTLSTRRKWTKTRREPQIGDIVLIAEDYVTKCKWPLRRVVQKYPGVNGLTRTVQVKTIRGMVTRPVARIHLLEAARED